ncbi:MAG TPA: antitoxin Xre/MbcA/ParS toxin-binding domain-containing protein [Longimicrobiaceae bacterium]|nr:antitoxin Xre/MbcA/ParS toxin-binding domain-containing protein [Longimicrobiaceae bacterium]
MAISVPAAHRRPPEEMGGPAFRTFLRIAEAWKLTPDEQMVLLGIPARSTFYKWRKEAPSRLPPDLLERLSYLFGIFKNLQILLPDERAADDWLHRPNHHPLFNGKSALDRMLSGRVADLYLVRQYLDAERGG